MRRFLDRYLDWVNVPVWCRGRLELRRLDIAVGCSFLFCVTYYWFIWGWLGALKGGMLFIFIAMCALWLL